MKKIISEVLGKFFEFDKISAEIGVQIAEKRIDLIVENLKQPKIHLVSETWIKYLFDHRNSWIIMEFKGPNEILSLDAILSTIYYKLLFAISKRVWFHDISAFLIGPHLARNIKEKLREKTRDYLKIVGNKAFYEVLNDKTLEIYIIAYDELDPTIPGNEILCMFSSKEKIQNLAIKKILETYSTKDILYSFILFYKPDITKEIKMKEPIPKENISKAVEIIGLDRLAEALGPEKLAKAVEIIGLDRLAEALGPEKLARALKHILSKLPDDERKRILRMLTK